eukprot:2781794-Rhodomonas_salina.2
MAHCRCRGSGARNSQETHVAKKSAAAGADPDAAANNPLYTPLNPPAFAKPIGDCTGWASSSRHAHAHPKHVT